jgi:hypothetical protein
MTVIELIRELNQYPHDAKVFIDCGEGEVQIDEVTGKIGLFTGSTVVIR